MNDPNQQVYWQQWKRSGNEDDLSKVMNTLTPVISSAVRSYGNNDPKLQQRAYILAREALDTYDPSQKTSVSTHVMNSLKKLYRVSAERRAVMHVPENVRLDAVKLRGVINEYKDKNGYEPSDLYVADQLGISMKAVQKAKGFGSEVRESDFATDKGDASATGERDETEIWKDYVYHDLDDKSRKILEMTTGYNNSPILKKGDIAQKLGISNAAVSQRIATIHKRLNEINTLPSTGPALP